MMIQCQHIKKYYGANLVLSDVTLEIKKGDKVGLIGRNGTGKTTLMSLINGSDQPDGGMLSTARDARIASLAQIPQFEEAKTVYEVLHTAFDDLLFMQQEMIQLEEAMASFTEQEGNASISGSLAGLHEAVSGASSFSMDEMLQRYGQLQEQFQLRGGYEMEASILRVANGLGISKEQLEQPMHSLSGGEKTKVGLAIILLGEPDLLLLDEPTNHLDMSAILWLEQFLVGFAGTVVAISHDRYFLDTVVNKIIEVEDGEAFSYHSNYSDYKVEKERILLQQFADYQEQQKKIKKMKETIKQLIEWGNRSNPPNPGFHRRAASMQKALDRMTKLKRPILERKAIDLKLSLEDRTGKDALVLQNVSKSYGDRTLFHPITYTLQYGGKAVIIGPNGAGKTTLFKSILGEVPLTEGEIKLGSRVQLGYLAQEEAPPTESLTVLQMYCTEVAMEQGEARNELAKFLFYGADVFKQVRSLSGGEWTRLRLAILMQQKPNLLLLDEPTNHLDIDSREALEEALLDYSGSLLAISHDRYFINKISNQVWAFEQKKLIVTHGNYNDYEHEAAKRRALQEKVLSSMVSAPVVKENKQQHAQQKLSHSEANSKSEKAKQKQLEEQIDMTEQELAAINEAMHDDTLASDTNTLMELHTQKEQLEEKLDQLLTQYIEL